MAAGRSAFEISGILSRRLILSTTGGVALVALLVGGCPNGTDSVLDNPAVVGAGGDGGAPGGSTNQPINDGSDLDSDPVEKGDSDGIDDHGHDPFDSAGGGGGSNGKQDGSDGNGGDGGGDDDPDVNYDEPAEDPNPEPTTAFFQALSGNSTHFAQTFATGLSGHGSVVVGGGLNSGRTQMRGFWWSPQSQFTDLGVLSGYSSATAYGISAGGTVVVGELIGSSAAQAFRWTPLGGIEPLGDLPGGMTRSAALAASADGRYIVGYGHSAAGFEAFYWSVSDGMIGLGDIPGGVFSSVATGVSGDGQTVVGTGHGALGSEAFVWTPSGGMVRLGSLSGGKHSRAYGVSSSGNAIVGASEASGARTRAFRATVNGQMIDLGDLSGGDDYSVAYAASADGNVIVGASSSSAGLEAFIWRSSQGMSSVRAALQNDHGISLNGWKLTAALAVSEGGRVLAGRGINPSGEEQAWIACLP